MKTKNEIRKELWAKREAQGLCVYCGKNSVKGLKTKGCDDCLDKKTKSQIKYSISNRDRINLYHKKIRKEVIDKYGGECTCCGEKEFLFLTIDHKNNDGNCERNELFGSQDGSSYSWFLKLKREPQRDDLQVLCFNCNLGRAINNGICPHHKPSPDNYNSTIDLRRDKELNGGCKIEWPENEVLIKQIQEIGLMKVAELLGVHNTTIRGRLKRREIYHLVNKK